MLIGMFPSCYIVPPISVQPSESNYCRDEKPTVGVEGYEKDGSKYLQRFLARQKEDDSE